MQLFRVQVSSKYLNLGCGVVGGLGICYALYKLVQYSSKWKHGRLSDLEATEDLNLPILLEHEYGDYRGTCEAADPIASAYLKHIPDSFFNFDQELFQYSSELFKQRVPKTKRALVVGSGVGKLVFNLGNIFEQVKGVDVFFSRVVTCYRLQNETEVSYNFPLEGSNRTVPKKARSWSAVSPSDSPKTVLRNKKKYKETIEFINGDIGSLSAPLHILQFQVVFVTDEIRDSRDPEQLLKNIHCYVETHGLLIIYTDYDWVRRTNQAEGFPEATTRSSFEFLKYTLSGFFNFLHQRYIQDVVGSSLRSCLIRNLHVTVWERNSRPILP